MPQRKFILLPLLMLLLSTVCLGIGPVSAGNYVVTTSGDNWHNSDLVGSLSWAIVQANNDPGSTISFNIPPTGTYTDGNGTVHSYSVVDPLTGQIYIDRSMYPWPEITANGTIIDGSTQPTTPGVTNSQGPIISIGSGLVIKAANCQLRDLQISRTNRNGIMISGPDAFNNTVTGCYIGTDHTGLTGVNPHHPDYTMGNMANGIAIVNGASGNRIEGNLIGWNQLNGITIDGDANVIQSNRINSNLHNGVAVLSGIGNSIQGNRIFGNTRLGIDLGYDGVTANDVGDTDAGSNNLQNSPTLAKAVSDMGGTYVEGTLNSVPGRTFSLEFFASADRYEGKVLLGSLADVTTDPTTGEATFSGNLLVAAPVGWYVTATATDEDGNTSEFSLGVLAEGAIATVNGIEPVAVGASTIMQFGAAPTDALNVSLTAEDSGSADVPPPPPGLEMGDSVCHINITNSAGVPITDFTTPVTLAVRFDPSLFEGDSWKQLRLYHYNAALAKWEDITTGLPTVDNSVNPPVGTIVGTTYSFSPFALMRPIVSTPLAKVNGGGSISNTRRNNKTTFSFDLAVNAAGQPQGTLSYEDRQTGVKVQSTSITAVTVRGSRAKVYGKATVNGTGNHEFVVDVDDNGEPGAQVDKFGLSINGYALTATLISSGNVQVK